ncbi:hypothetical protein EJB05_49431, partial [Eragrostis curvula]
MELTTVEEVEVKHVFKRSGFTDMTTRVLWSIPLPDFLGATNHMVYISYAKQLNNCKQSLHHGYYPWTEGRAKCMSDLFYFFLFFFEDRMSDISEPSGDEKSAGDEIQAPAVHGERGPETLRWCWIGSTAGAGDMPRCAGVQ